MKKTRLHGKKALKRILAVSSFLFVLCGAFANSTDADHGRVLFWIIRVIALVCSALIVFSGLSLFIDYFNKHTKQKGIGDLLQTPDCDGSPIQANTAETAYEEYESITAEDKSTEAEIETREKENETERRLQESARIAAVEAEIQERRKSRDGNAEPIEILIQKGECVYTPDDAIKHADTMQQAAQSLCEAFNNDSLGILTTVPVPLSETEWTFDADFLNGVLHCTVTRQEKTNTTRYILTDWTPDIWKELEQSMQSVFGAGTIGERTVVSRSILCKVCETDNTNKKILWIEDAFTHEKAKHRFDTELLISYRDTESAEQTDAADHYDDWWDEFSEAQSAYEIFRNDRFPIFYTDGSFQFIPGAVIRSWCALAVSGNGAVYMDINYDEPWLFSSMTATKLTDAFLEDILYAYELRYNRKMRCSISYGAQENHAGTDGRMCYLTIEPAEEAAENRTAEDIPDEKREMKQ